MKKVCLFAILVLAAAAVTNEAMKKEEFKKNAKAQMRAYFNKRDTCSAIKCGKDGDTCDASTICQTMTSCVDGVCRQSAKGDACGDESPCYSSSLYCDSKTKTCQPNPKIGDKCETDCGYNLDKLLYCSSLEKVCKAVPEKIGDECDIESGVLCPTGSYCTATMDAPKGKCKELPNSVGADCSETEECNELKNVYCDATTKKCAALPGKDEDCYAPIGSTPKCAAGFVCNAEKKCVSQFAKVGEACGITRTCDEGLKCRNSTCVKDDGKCTTSADCKYKNKAKTKTKTVLI